MKRKTYRYRLYQGGVMVVYVEAPTKEQAVREIQHYAMMYLQDGPVKIVPRPQGEAKR